VLVVLVQQTQFRGVASLTQVAVVEVFFRVQQAQVAQVVAVLVVLELEQVERQILVAVAVAAVLLLVVVQALLLLDTQLDKRKSYGTFCRNRFRQ
jgi:hypothetical protein